MGTTCLQLYVGVSPKNGLTCNLTDKKTPKNKWQKENIEISGYYS